MAQDEVLETLTKEGRYISVPELSRILNLSLNAVRENLNKLLKAKEVVRKRDEKCKETLRYIYKINLRVIRNEK